MTLLIGVLKPFEIFAADGSTISAQVILTRQAAKLAKLVAHDCNLILMDVAVTSAEYAALDPLLANSNVRTFSIDALSGLRSELLEAFEIPPTAKAFADLRRRIVHAITGQWPAKPIYDPRIETALTIIHESRLDKISLVDIAKAVHLSPSRLRHLFKESVGETLSHYALSAIARRALLSIADGIDVTTSAYINGFHDAAHFSRSYGAMFGSSPTSGPRAGVALIRCE